MSTIAGTRGEVLPRTACSVAAPLGVAQNGPSGVLLVGKADRDQYTQEAATSMFTPRMPLRVCIQVKQT